MGFFSWKTADSGESIANVYSGKRVRPVYLLQPDGENIREDAYEGYGEFGGVDAYEWLAERNFGDSSLTSAAISSDCGDYLEDARGNIWLCSLHLSERDARHIFGNRNLRFFPHFMTRIPELKCNANEAVESGLFKRRHIKDDYPLSFPLKFSFNRNASYYDLTQSDHCEAQGFFYDCEEV